MFVKIVGVVVTFVVGVLLGFVIQKKVNESKKLSYMQLVKSMNKNSIPENSFNFQTEIRTNKLLEKFSQLKDNPFKIAFKGVYGELIFPETAQIEDFSNGACVVFYDTNSVHYDKKGRRKNYIF